jgi:hypothetical protein
MLKRKNETKILYYESAPNLVDNLLKPSNRVVPDWYKKIPRFVQGLDGPETKSVKHCIPFIDALTTGYMLLTPKDIYFEQTKDGLVGRWDNEWPLLDERPTGQTGEMPAPLGCDEKHFLWVTQTSVEIPEGYSLACVHPINRTDLPFITVGGIVDGPFIMHAGNFPFYVKKGFEGLIPQGTPFMQIIPFDRTNWFAKKKDGVYIDGVESTRTEDYNQGSWYRRKKWQKKSYK